MKQIELVKIVAFNKLVEALKLDKLSGKEKYELMKIFRKIKVVSSEFDEFKQDVINKYVNSDDFKALVDKSKENDESAKKEIERINSEANDIVYRELLSIKDVDFDPIDEEMFIKFIDSNENLKVSDTMLLEEVLL